MAPTHEGLFTDEEVADLRDDQYIEVESVEDVTPDIDPGLQRVRFRSVSVYART